MKTMRLVVLMVISGLSVNSALANRPAYDLTSFYVTMATPPAPTLTGTTPPSPSNNPSPTVNGTTSPGALVSIFKNGVCGGAPATTTTANGIGNFSVAVSVNLNTTTTISANADDGLGVSPCSSPITYKHDGVAPPAPTITGTVPPSPSSNTTPTVTGTAEPNSLVNIYLNGSCSGPPAASGLTATGTFNLNVTVPSNATTTITATATDQAGNTSTCSAPFFYTNDTIPPPPPAFTGTSPASPANNNHPHILGAAEPGSTVVLFTNDSCTDPAVSSGTADNAGNFDIGVIVPNNTTTTFYAHALDSAGNVSECTPSGITYVEDSNLPTGSICGFKYLDINGNGVYEPGLGETPLPGWTIVAVSSEGDTLSTVTDIDGNYCFNNVTDTLYKVFELPQPGYIQTGGEPYYALSLLGDVIDSVDFGNFKSGQIYGTKFNDANGDSLNNDGPGLKDWTICLAPKQLPPRIGFHLANATATVTVNGLPEGTAIASQGYIIVQYGTLSGDTRPMEITYFFKSVGGLSLDAEVTDYKEGGASLGGFETTGNDRSSFFDVFTEIELVAPGGGCYVSHTPVHISGPVSGSTIEPGTLLRGGPVQLFDKTTGQPAGSLDSLSLLVGNAASPSNPMCTITDTTGTYCFMNVPPGLYNVDEVSQPCWEQITPDPPPISVASGDSVTGIDFGNRQGETRICVLKIFDENHNQIADPNESPMEGVQFTLTGANPLNVYTAVTDASGSVCFDDVNPDDYVLTENVPEGFQLSSPKSGVMTFQVTSCQDTTVTWLNTAAFTDSLFRTATVEQWATAIDQKGKRKPVKCKPDKVDFKINLVWQVDHLRLKFPMYTRGELRLGKDKQQAPFFSWDSLKVVDIGAIPHLSPPFDTLQIDGRGFKGKPITLTYEWSSGGAVIAKNSLPRNQLQIQGDAIKVNALRIPMPNFHNVGEDLAKLGAFPLLLGQANGIHSVIHLKYKDVQKSLVKDDHGILRFHTDSVRCLDQKGGKSITRQLKTFAPDAFGGNKLFAEVLALKLNLFASKTGRFPAGLDTLIYDDSAVEPGHPLNGKSIGEICSQADVVLGCDPDPKGNGLSPLDYYVTVHRINSSFGSPVPDTLSWGCTNLAFKGVKALKSVPWLRANPGSLHTVTVPGVLPAAEPVSFLLGQNYPNPFNPTTTIQFDLLEPALVTLKIYNTLGQEVRSLLDEQLMDEGSEEVEFDAARLPTGVYFYRIVAQGVGDEEEGIVGRRHVEVKKMMLLK